MTDTSAIPIGTTITHDWVVTHEMTVASHGVVDLPVLATPNLVFMLEDTCVFAVQPYLDAGDLTVGTEVQVKHLAAAKTGESVVTHAELVAAKGRRLSFRIEARCGGRTVAAGTHERAVVNAEEFKKRLMGS
ncbi:thioesterase family protein [Aquabacter sp. CN5-332]|uniref:thioesterase family protein n=1 Tax=Aquabacter sp. CN5-332 TaxID=3156608 RepID=UPI0032B356AF